MHLEAMRTVPRIYLIFGNFIEKAFWRPLANIPIAKPIGHSQDVILHKKQVEWFSSSRREHGERR
jgi:hypothetical protein